jgi:hypothetical protein
MSYGERTKARKEHDDQWRSTCAARYTWRRMSRKDRLAMIEALFSDPRPCFQVLAAIAPDQEGIEDIQAYLAELNRCRINWQIHEDEKPGDAIRIHRQDCLRRVPVVDEPPDSADFRALCLLLAPKSARVLELELEPRQCADQETLDALALEGAWLCQGTGTDGLTYRWLVFKERDL